jgi:uncharacterized protein YutE (UPF0331/DUF86 family)
MTTKPVIKDIKIARKELEKEMIKGILEYLRNGTFPNNNPNSYMNAYTLVQGMADAGDSESEALFNYHNKTIQGYIEDCYNLIRKETKSQLIDSFIKQTENINFLIYWMNRIFTYLDRFFTKAKNKNSLSQNAISLYRQYFFDPIQSDIYIEVNKLIKEDRNCNIESRPKIKTILKILYDIDLDNPKIVKENNKISWVAEKGVETRNNATTYQDKWFQHFSIETNKFAKDKGNADIHNMSAPEYIVSQLKFIDEESVRETEYINPKYHPKINEIIYKFLIGENAEELSKMDTGIPYMFSTKRNEELKNTFQLFKYHPQSLDVITGAFVPYIRKRGEDINQNKEITKDPKKFIPQLISLKKEMDSLVAECFENHPQFQDKKNKAFSLFMVKDLYAKQLSNYTDFCMRNGFKGKSQEEIENTLNDIIGLYKCLNSKLVFQLETNKKMSDRLIKNVSLSTNTEKIFISKLKQESGVTYVNKMTEMMNDLEKNKKEIESYKSSQSKGIPNGIKFNIQVISQSAWDINNKSMEKIELTPFLKVCLEDFENFYLKKHSGQKLRWCLGLSKLDIQHLKLKNKNISISTLPQYLTLYYLEKNGALTILKVAELLGCQVSTVLTDIHGLVFNPSYNPQGQAEKGLIVGSFNANTKEFKETDTISLNKNFTVARQKFNTLPLAVKKSAAEVRETELEEAQITKRYQDNILQATLTRIMKSRIGQTTTHVWLINEASKQIDLFKAQPQQIKENIEKLIEKNIMKRSDKNRTCYDYIA